MWWWHSRLVDDPTASADALGCNRRRLQAAGARPALSPEVAFEGQRTRLFGRLAGVRASGRVHGTVGL